MPDYDLNTPSVFDRIIETQKDKITYDIDNLVREAIIAVKGNRCRGMTDEDLIKTGDMSVTSYPHKKDFFINGTLCLTIYEAEFDSENNMTMKYQVHYKEIKNVG